ncbi:hypothetical protein [Streptomyces phaeochromogenes]
MLTTTRQDRWKCRAAEATFRTGDGAWHAGQAWAAAYRGGAPSI